MLRAVWSVFCLVGVWTCLVHTEREAHAQGEPFVGLPADEKLFEGPQSFPLDASANAAVADDFDGDGNIDVAVTQEAAAQVRFLYRKSDGSFEESRALEVGLSPVFLVSAKIDDDDRPDLVCVNSGSSDVSIALNRGARKFEVVSKVDTGTNPRVAGAGDFDLDGVLDLAISNLLSNDIAIALGNGDGTFTDGESLRVGDNPHFLVVGDYDDDEHDDILLINSLSRVQGMLSFFHSNGDGTFAPAVQTFLGGRGEKTPRFLATGFYNDDHLPDAAALTDEREVHVFINLGEGKFDPALVHSNENERFVPTFLVSADYDADGNADLLTPLSNDNDAGARLFPGDGQGSFGDPRDVFFGEEVAALQILDFNADGIDDVMTAWGPTAEIAVHTSESPGVLIGRRRLGLPTAPVDLARLDPERGEKGELLVLSALGFFHVTNLERALPTPAVPLEQFPAGTMKRFELVDLDGDGIRDIAAIDSNIPASLAIHLLGRDFEIRESLSYLVGISPFDLMVRDFDGDDALDVAVGSLGDSQITVFRSPHKSDLDPDEERTFAFPIEGRGVIKMTNADFNGDGHVDIVAATRANLTIIYGDGRGGEIARKEFPEYRRATDVKGFNLEGDDRPELLVTVEDELLIFRDVAVPTAVDGAPLRFRFEGNEDKLGSIVMVDIQRDGSPELLTTSRSKLYILERNAEGQFVERERHRIGYLARKFLLDDFDEDGSLDFVSADTGSIGLSVLYGQIPKDVAPEPTIRRGDADSNGDVNLTDAVFTLNQLFSGGPRPACPDAADADDSGSVNLTDAIVVLNYLFRQGPVPAAPGAEECGRDPTPDPLGFCESECR